MPAEAGAGARERCPFCEGREERTPPELWAERPGDAAADSPGWLVRSLPNLYPVLADERESPGEEERAPGAVPRVAAVAAVETAMGSSVDPLRASSRGSEPDLFGGQPAAGIHEVIVHSPQHETSLADLDETQLGRVVSAWRERMRAAAETSSYVHLIVNEGPAAGASLEHTHAQLYGLRFVPAEVARERERATAYHQRTMGGHLLGDVASEEVRRRERLVAVDDEAILIAPWASRAPFELRIVPRRPAPSFERDEGGAAMVATALRALESALGARPQLNLWIRTAPRGTDEFCWHIDLVPRLTVRAGFELGTGVDVDVYPPERAAADLREALAP